MDQDLKRTFSIEIEQRRRLQETFRDLLLNNVVPFWQRYGIDWQEGGVLTCIGDDGSLLSTDKFIWSQARSVWTFSALYNRVDQCGEFLRVADNSVRFLMSHGRDSAGRWVYHTDRAGNVLEGATSIYSDCFVVYGLSEYFRSCQDQETLAIARETFERIRRRIEEPDFQETAPYLLPLGWRNHGIPMIMAEVSSELAQTTGDSSLEAVADDYVQRIMDHFVRPGRKAVFEFLTRDYNELPAPAGTFVMPGHAIECMWFVMQIAARRGNRELIQRAAEVMLWHLEFGWDTEYGGILLSLDFEGHRPYLPHSEMKVWWPHTEAMYGTLLAFHLTGRMDFLDWFEKVSQWAWEHFPVPTGEWRQRLARDGKPSAEVVALPVKDPFHLPRSAILILQLLDKMEKETTAESEGVL